MTDLEKLEQLVKSATNPRQKAMAESLLKKFLKEQQKTEPQTEEVLSEISTSAITTAPASSSTEISAPAQTPAQAPAAPEENDANNGPLFKAVGVIQGEVNLAEDGNNTVTIKGKVYRLKYAYEKRRTFEALKLEIKKSGKVQRLIVYPRAIHFPSKDQPHTIYFELVGFEGASVQDKGIINELNDLGFKLSGLWQFIPVCRTPCVSIFRNYSESRKLFIKRAQPFVKVRFMKAAHLPLLWKDSPTKPFRFNPKLDKEEQGKPNFIQIKAKFLPERDSFGSIDQLADPLPDSPRFLKASKEDKAEQRKNSAQPKTSKPSKPIKPVPKPAKKVPQPTVAP